MRNNKSNRGVEPIISALLLIVITVFAFGLVYGVYSSWISTQRSGSMLEMQERLVVEDVRFDSGTSASLFVVNVGKADATISRIEINGGSSTITSDSLSIVSGLNMTITVTYPAGFTSGTTYNFKLITARGTNAGTFATR